MLIKVGCCGFPQARSRYWQELSVVEIQQTFYQPPALATAQKWREEAPEGFEFTMKAWQLITHPASSPTYRRLKTPVAEDKKARYGFFCPGPDVLAAWQATQAVAHALKASLVVFQCPPSFSPAEENLENLRRFFKVMVSRDFLLAWEPRGNWGQKEVANLCEELGLIYCLDPFKGSPQPGLVRYFRLHGLGGYKYRYTERDLSQIKEWCQKEGTTFVMFNNVSMWEDALRFKRLADS